MWRQELARRDSLGTGDELQNMIASLSYAQREELRGWLIQQQRHPVEDPATAATTRRELDALLPWISADGQRCLVRVARAFAENR